MVIIGAVDSGENIDTNRIDFVIVAVDKAAD